MAKKTGYIEREGLTFEVKILDERELFGRKEYKVQPIGGSGEKWVTAVNVLDMKVEK